MLDILHKYVDERAHVVGGEIRYSVKLRGKWQRRVLGNTEQMRIFEELHHE